MNETILSPARGSLWLLPGGGTVRVLRLVGNSVEVYWLEGHSTRSVSLRYFQPNEPYALTPREAPLVHLNAHGVGTPSLRLGGPSLREWRSSLHSTTRVYAARCGVGKRGKHHV